MRVLSVLVLPLIVACAGFAAEAAPGETKPATPAEGAKAEKPDPAVVGDWIIEEDGHSIELILGADGSATAKKDGEAEDKKGSFTTKDGVLSMREGDREPESINYKAEKDQITLTNPKDGMTLVLKRAVAKPSKETVEKDAPAKDAPAPAAK